MSQASGTTRVAVVAGPTGSGKSAFAERLVECCDAEIVSADALQVYRGLDIGTAKPSRDDQRRFRYHGVDLLGPGERCTAGSYADFTRPVIAAIAERGRLPLMVGGSGFYVDAALGRLDPLPASDPVWRAKLEDLAARNGAAAMHRWLRRLDPARANEVDANDRQRVLRALEIVMRAGRPIADIAAMPTVDAPTNEVLFLGLHWPRDQLYRRINARVDAMLADGWIDEVRGLLGAGVDPASHSMKAIGYRHLCAVIGGEMTLDEARVAIARDTRRYAKRQITYFRRWPVRWIEMNEDTPSASEEAATAAAALLADE